MRFFSPVLNFRPVRKAAVEKKDVAICLRLREAREFLGVTQAECAEQLGLERSTFANYERSRAPMKYDVALRFCRQFIISEEWLATGRHDACHASAKAHGQDWNREMDELIFRRQCMDLTIEPAVQGIAPNTRFSEAWAQTLAPIYGKLVLQFYYHPRVALHDEDNADISVNLLKAIHERHLLLLRNEARRLKKSEGLVSRTYARCCFEAADLVMKKFLGAQTPVSFAEEKNWLRFALENPSEPIGPLLVDPEPVRQAPVPVGKPVPAKK